jgi:pimeloyl-ACP methyl ester carboxylesterase
MKVIDFADTPVALDRRRLSFGLALFTASACLQAMSEAKAAPSDKALVVTHYRTRMVDGIRIFYREAGPAGAPVVLLLHGFPTSSHMFRNLIPELADRYHVIAPDYPGYGQSDMPDRTAFSYTFDRFGELVDGLLGQLNVKRYAMYVMDYGAPVGWRLSLKHPERITALIVQNGNAYDEGLREFWDPIKAYWSDHSEDHRKALYVLVAPILRLRTKPTKWCR